MSRSYPPAMWRQRACCLVSTYDGWRYRIAEAYESKYGSDWRFTVRNGHFFHQGLHEGAGAVLVFEVAPVTAFGFRKGEEFSQTRWRF